ncbi:MAG: tRNA lysidine(34) synthetase TilS [Cytophagaceae bacterium]|nr:tRNA lysidine(34) synthetase TilS [Cytophagaceae bacterium]
MLEAFQQQLEQLWDRSISGPMLIACSGGLDSVVLAHLAHQSKLNFALAHCNFKLRGDSSDQDQSFVKALGHSLGVKCYTTTFDTTAFAKAQGISIQMAARRLRYDWFEKLRKQHRYPWLFTAHHLNDSLETFMINTGRGTGLSGLLGIPEDTNRVLRPLLPFSRKQIHQYALDQKLEWREDSSNASDHYLRNHLRHHAIVNWEEAQPQLLENFKNTLAHLKQTDALLKVYVDGLRQQFCYPIDSIQGPSGVVIALDKLIAHPQYEAVLYALLSPYGFTAWADIYRLPQSQSGKQIFSSTHRVLKNRAQLEVYPLAKVEQGSYQWSGNKDTLSGGFGILRKEALQAAEPLSKNEIIVDADRLQFPLVIRRWQHGDYFYPLGMQGKKKLSKFFKDKKLSLVAKQQVWVLCSGEDIVWIIDHRADQRFGVVATTQHYLKITHI